MHGFLASVRYGLRLLLKSPGFTVTAVLILGIGIGANTAIFSLINAVLLKPLPYSHSERLVKISMRYQNAPEGGVDYPDYSDVSGGQKSFDSMALFCQAFLDLTGSGRRATRIARFANDQ